MLSDLPLFLGQLLRNPRMISAVVPSSRALAQAMAEPLLPGTGPVAEFGPGTGRITRAILDRGIAADALTLYEMNTAFAARLVQDFPGVRVVNGPAQAAAQDFDGTLAAVVSGLPLLSMPQTVQHDILAAAFAALRPGGIYIQFTYGPKPPLAKESRRALGLCAMAGPRVWGNMPPARVHVYCRAAERACATQ